MNDWYSEKNMLNKLAGVKQTHSHVVTLMTTHNCSSKISFTNDKMANFNTKHNS